MDSAYEYCANQSRLLKQVLHSMKECSFLELTSMMPLELSHIYSKAENLLQECSRGGLHRAVLREDSREEFFEVVDKLCLVLANRHSYIQTCTDTQEEASMRLLGLLTAAKQDLPCAAAKDCKDLMSWLEKIIGASYHSPEEIVETAHFLLGAMRANTMDEVKKARRLSDLDVQYQETEMELKARGPYGSVYKGTCWKGFLDSIAVRKAQVEEDSKLLAIMLSVRHPNVIHAIGYSCFEKSEIILMELMDDNLESFLEKLSAIGIFALRLSGTISSDSC